MSIENECAETAAGSQGKNEPRLQCQQALSIAKKLGAGAGVVASADQQQLRTTNHSQWA
jgi:hypothetical protein